MRTAIASLLVMMPVAGLSVGGCATSTYSDETAEGKVTGAMERPFRDIGLMRENAPEILKHAEAELYRLPQNDTCESLSAEIIDLDLVLGPDLDTRNEDQDEGAINAQSLAAGAIGSVLDIPFRGVVRWVSGADAREKALALSVLSGMVRRAFLKGVHAARGCAPSS